MKGGTRKNAGRPKKNNHCTLTIRCSEKAYKNFKSACEKLELSQGDFFNRQMESLF